MIDITDTHFIPNEWDTTVNISIEDECTILPATLQLICVTLYVTVHARLTLEWDKWG